MLINKIRLALLGHALLVMSGAAFSQNLDVQSVDYYVARHSPVNFIGHLNDFAFAGSSGFSTEFFWAGLKDIYRDGVALNPSDYRVSAVNKHTATGPGWCMDRCEYLTGGISRVTTGGMLPGQYAATIDFSLALRPNSLPNSSVHWRSFYPSAQFDWEVKNTKTYVLAIGVRDVLAREPASGIPVTYLKDDEFVLSLKEKFESKGAEVLTIQRDVANGFGISKEEIAVELKKIKDKIGPDDTLIFYAGSHGQDVNGTEFLQLGPLSGDPNKLLEESQYFLTDTELTVLLKPFDDVQKIVFLDACRSGGFWNSGNSGETEPQLESLQNIALFAAAPEGKLAGANFWGGTSYFADALAEAVDIGLETFSAASLGEFLKTKSTSWFRASSEWFEKAKGDPLPADFTPELFASASADFGAGDSSLMAAMGSSTSAVPEPATVAMLGMGLAGVIVMSRKRSCASAPREG